MVYAIKQFTVTDLAGDVVSGATVTVTNEDGGGTAVIYSDRDGNSVKDNPFTTDSNGQAVFYAPAGAYRIDIVKGSFSATYRHVAVGTAAEHDADEFGQLEATLRWRELANISNENLDDLLVAGFYVGSNLTNAPGGSSGKFYINVLTNQDTPEDTIQLAYSEGASPVLYLRCRISGSWGSWITFPTTGAANAWTAQQYFSLATLTDATSIAWNLNTAQVAKVTLGGNRTLANPTNGQEGGVYILIVCQPGSSSTRTLSYDTDYEWPDDDPPVIATGNNVRTVLTFVRENSKMRGVAALNYTA